MKLVPLGLLAAVLVLVGWVRLLPLEIDGVRGSAAAAVRAQIAAEVGGGAAEVERWIAANRAAFNDRLRSEVERQQAAFSFETPSGDRVPYSGGFDSFVWLRAARNVLRSGTPCDSIVDGACRDDFTLAPVGTISRYASSFHVQALAFTHRLLTVFSPDVPLSLSAFYMSFAVALIGMLPAFWLGRRFGGAIGGATCAILVSVNSAVLYRTFAADNDIWNIVLPLFEIWAAVEAIYAEKRSRRAFYVLVAAAVTGLHAAIWRGWFLTSGIIVLGFAAYVLLWSVRRLLHGVRPGGESDRGAFETAALLLGGYLVAATLATLAVGAESSPLSGAATLVSQVTRAIEGSPSDVGDQISMHWPSVFETVGELRKPNLAAVAQSMSGPVYFFVGWLGLILLMLPRSNWQPWHFAILIGGNLLYRYLLSYQSIDPWTLALLLILPLAVAVGAFLADRDSPLEDQGAGAMIIFWFMAGLLLSFRGTRFLIILAQPLGVLCAVAVGRLYQWVERQSWASPPLSAAILFALLAALYPPVARGERVARTYMPIMNDNWHGALTKLRDETPPESIVNTWWDYGYFVKHTAERRVLSDGGTLGTHVHYWFARALSADSETEMLGLLRMLNCGSDALPEPEGRLGAFGRLLDAGVSDGVAQAVIVEMASLPRPAAEKRLEALGLSRDQSTAVLQATHCEPAPAYLVLPADFGKSIGWRQFGSWSFLAASAAGDPNRSALLAAYFGIDEEKAAAAIAAAATPRPRAPRYATLRWKPCDGDSILRCPIELPQPSGETLVAVSAPIADAAAVRLIVRGRDGGEREVRPRWIVVPAPDRMRVIEGSADGIESVLVDLEKRRVLVGDVEVLRSSATRLLFLGDEHLDRFEPFDRRSGPAGEVITWRILW